jgi:hypothetical protein
MPGTTCDLTSRRPTGESPASTSVFGNGQFGPGSSRSTPTSPIRVRSAEQARVGQTASPSGRDRVQRAVQRLASCGDPAGLQAICDPLGPADIDAFFDRWMSVLPVPLTDADRAVSYWWVLSNGTSNSRTIVSTHPRQLLASALVVIGRARQERSHLRGPPPPVETPTRSGAYLEDPDRDPRTRSGSQSTATTSTPGHGVRQRRPAGVDLDRHQRCRRSLN